MLLGLRMQGDRRIANVDHSVLHHEIVEEYNSADVVAVENVDLAGNGRGLVGTSCCGCCSLSLRVGHMMGTNRKRSSPNYSRQSRVIGGHT